MRLVAGARLGGGRCGSSGSPPAAPTWPAWSACGPTGRSPTTTSHALERAAAVAALLITREQAVTAVENKYQGDFLRDLFLGRPGDEAYVEEHAAAFGWDLDRPVVVRGGRARPDRTATRSRSPAPQRRQWQERFSAAWRQVVREVDRRHPARRLLLRGGRACCPIDEATTTPSRPRGRAPRGRPPSPATRAAAAARSRSASAGPRPSLADLPGAYAPGPAGDRGRPPGPRQRLDDVLRRARRCTG